MKDDFIEYKHEDSQYTISNVIYSSHHQHPTQQITGICFRGNGGKQIRLSILEPQRQGFEQNIEYLQSIFIELKLTFVETLLSYRKHNNIWEYYI